MPQFQPQFGRYCLICITLLVWFATLPGHSVLCQERGKVLLQEKYRVGGLYRIETSTEINGVLQVPDQSSKTAATKSIRKSGTAKSNYLERVLDLDQDNLATKTIRLYSQLSAQQNLDGQTESASLRNQIRNIILIREPQRDVTFSPDGPMTLGELEQVRTDVFVPRLSGLLPTQAVSVNDSWTPTTQAVQELTDLQQIQSGQLQCSLQRIDKSADQELAIVNISGKVSGISQQGPNQQTLQGKYHFDLQSQRLIFLQFEVTSIFLDKNQKKVGDLTASYRLVRQLKPANEIKIDGLALEPTEENTLLLVREPKLGIELTHSRRWAPRPAQEKNWIIDGPSGSGMTIQFETAGNIPDAEKVRKEIESTLSKAAQGLKPEPDPAGWAQGNQSVQRLSWRGTQNGKEYVFDYFLWKSFEKGAIIAARYFAPEAVEAKRDAERIARSLQIAK